MQPKYLLELLNHPHKVMPEDVASLQDLAQRYPYFQAVYALLAKAAYDQDQVAAKQSIELAALHAADRNQLKALLEDMPPFAVPSPAPPEPKTLTEKESKQAGSYDFINGYVNTIRQKSKRPITKQQSLAQLHIIQDFIQKDVQFRPRPMPAIPSKEPQDDLTQQSTALNDNLVTESLAQVLVQQGKLERAIDIYTQLLLKFPEKKAYFDVLIKELKNQR